MGQTRTACVGRPNAYEYVVPLPTLSLKTTGYSDRGSLRFTPTADSWFIGVEVPDRIFIEVNDAFVG